MTRWQSTAPPPRPAVPSVGVLRWTAVVVIGALVLTAVFLLATRTPTSAGASAVSTRSSTPPPTPGATRVFQADYLRFTYPSTWYALPAVTDGGFSLVPVVYVSTHSLTVEPCESRPDPDGRGGSSTCPNPFRSLADGGAYLALSYVTTRGISLSLAALPGQLTTVAGHPALIRPDAPYQCGGIDAAYTREISISLNPLRANDGVDFSIVECIGPGSSLQQNTEAVDQLVAGLRFES